MILDLKIKNFLSFKKEVVLSFEATKDKRLEDYQVVEVAKGVRLLKLAIVYGANASGKSNLLEAFEFLRDFWLRVPDSKEDETGVVPFLLDPVNASKPSEFMLTFYIGKMKFSYSLKISDEFVLSERLDFYPSVQPANIFDRKLVNNVSEIVFGPKIKVSQIAKDEIAIKCLPNMSVFAAYQQVNTKIVELESASNWMTNQFMPSIETGTPLIRYSEGLVAENKEAKEKILSFLKKADFNISDINSEIIDEEITDEFLGKIKELQIPKNELEKLQKERSIRTIKTTFEHEVVNEDQSTSKRTLPINMQSDGTRRVFGLSGAIVTTLKQNAFLVIDEIESKLHPRLIEYVIEQFLRESDKAQLLLSTHYDGLLEEDDLLRKDNIWFTEKKEDASTALYSLADFKAVNRITSIQKAYKYGKFGAIPNIE